MSNVIPITSHPSFGQAVYFSDWPDAWLLSRREVLVHIEEGTVNPDSIPKFMYDELFPEGFDPTRHPGENLGDVMNEIERRGI